MQRRGSREVWLLIMKRSGEPSKGHTSFIIPHKGRSGNAPCRFRRILNIYIYIVEKPTVTQTTIFPFATYMRSSRAQAGQTQRRAVSRCRCAMPDEVARTSGTGRNASAIICSARCVRRGVSVSTYRAAFTPYLKNAILENNFIMHG